MTTLDVHPKHAVHDTLGPRPCTKRICIVCTGTKGRVVGCITAQRFGAQLPSDQRDGMNVLSSINMQPGWWDRHCVDQHAARHRKGVDGHTKGFSVDFGRGWTSAFAPPRRGVPENYMSLRRWVNPRTLGPPTAHAQGHVRWPPQHRRQLRRAARGAPALERFSPCLAPASFVVRGPQGLGKPLASPSSEAALTRAFQSTLLCE